MVANTTIDLRRRNNEDGKTLSANRFCHHTQTQLRIRQRKKNDSEMKKQRPVSDKQTNTCLSCLYRSNGSAIRFNLGGVFFYFVFLVEACKNIFAFSKTRFVFLLSLSFAFVRLFCTHAYVCLFFRSVDFIGFTCTRTFPLLSTYYSTSL